MFSYSEPQFYLQLGYHDQTKAIELLKNNISSGVITSLRHLNESNLSTYLKEYKELDANIYIDPQFYNPEYINTKNGYPFFQEAIGTETLENDAKLREIIYGFLDYQISQGVDKILIPVEYLNQTTSNWFERTTKIIDITKEYLEKNSISKSTLIPLAVNIEIVKDVKTREIMLNWITSFDVDGFIIAFNTDSWKPINYDYIIGFLDIIFNLKKNFYEIIHGFGSYFSFLGFTFGLDGFATGGFSNRRSFDPEEWISSDIEDDDAFKRSRKPRYWTLSLLNCVKFPDEAELLYEKNLWGKIRTETIVDEILFKDQSPAISGADWKQNESFLQYFHTCNILTKKFKGSNLASRKDTTLNLLNEAQKTHEMIRRNGVRLDAKRQGGHISEWKVAFKDYYNQVEDDLKMYFG